MTASKVIPAPPHVIAPTPHVIATPPHVIATPPHVIATPPHVIPAKAGIHGRSMDPGFRRDDVAGVSLRRAAPACLIATLAALLPCTALAQSTGGASLPLLVGQGAGGASYSVPIQTLLFFTALSFLPAVLLLMTGFTRIVIVLSLLRQAIGTQAAPPNQVVVGLSLFLTFFVMGPTIDKVYAEAYQPYAENRIAFDEALKRGEVPMRAFMLKQTRQADVMLFAKLAKVDPSVKSADVPFKVLVPAFVTSELKSAFQIGFLIFIPFLVIDMIVASVLMSLGMMMLSPVLVALPFKLMLFVLADGWNLLLGSLAASFAV
jgi:flagellar biosynthetic protein FliP